MNPEIEFGPDRAPRWLVAGAGVLGVAVIALAVVGLAVIA